MDQTQTVAIILVALVVVGVIFAPPLVSEFFKGFRDFFEDFRNTWFEDWGDLGKNGTEINGVCSIGAIVHYTDGSNETLKINELLLMPLSVQFGDDPRDLLSIEFQIWTSFTYEGTLQSIGRDVTLEFDLENDGTSERVVDQTSNYPYPDLVKSGGAFKLAEMTLSSSQIQGYATQSGDYTSLVKGRVNVLTLTWTDATVERIATNDATGTFKFHVTKTGTTSLVSVYISYTKCYDVPENK